MNNSTDSRRLNHRQYPLSQLPLSELRRQRGLSVHSPQSLRQQQRGRPLSQKSRDLCPRSYQVVSHSWIEKALTGFSLASLMISSGFAIAPSQVSFRPDATRQSSVSSAPAPSMTVAEQTTVAEQLFATPDSIGAIAIGVAEGTRTRDGGKTSLWQQHIDPGNHAKNQGTFSWQLGATSVADAEQQGLNRMRQDAIPHLLQDAENMGVPLNMDVLVQGADLWNQSPQAGADFVENLKQCQQVEDQEFAAVLCARISSYVNPNTGEVEAAGFANDPIALRDDQQRRMQAIQSTLH
ncbi:hypothetical protein JOY44_03015 [Phormidium sp. CLA17]|uniref:hypothetical protein n=1 Tax=Leptolyngbya sp. Cla-17 TaxID=2803751 RepID=UPI00149147BE|nr:hypothetical protein [Leptolyngbya sp. Cla-17]MBM0740596.1 hypothetical protein [Leptolyngbya sp. Cla-17]